MRASDFKKAQKRRKWRARLAVWGEVVASFLVALMCLMVLYMAMLTFGD